MDRGELKLGDLSIVGAGVPPAKLIKALAIVSTYLHPTWDAWIPKNKSKESCVLCALTVRDFLHTIGFAARVKSVLFLATAQRNGILLHSLGMGAREASNAPSGNWNGHLVTVAGNWLIDTTLYQVQRPAWPQLPAMIAIPTQATGCRYNEMSVLSSIASNGDANDEGYLFDAAWILDRKNRGWKCGPDSRNKMLREPVIWELVERFRGWDE